MQRPLNPIPPSAAPISCPTTPALGPRGLQPSARPRRGPTLPPGPPTHDPAQPWARGGGPRYCHRLLCPVTAPETGGVRDRAKNYNSQEPSRPPTTPGASPSAVKKTREGWTTHPRVPRSRSHVGKGRAERVGKGRESHSI